LPFTVPPDSPGSRALLAALATRAVVADGAMGTMLQRSGLSPSDFVWDGIAADGCNELLNLTRPDVVATVHDAYLAQGVDAITTNTFGANATNLADYGLADLVEELAAAGAQIARERADAAAAELGEPRWVLGSLGPGTKLPTLGDVNYADLRDTYRLATRGLLADGIDAVMIETVQDLLQAKAAINGARMAMREMSRSAPIFVSITVEENGKMLLGTDVAAALVLLQALGADVIGLNCATGPDLMAEHLEFLAAHSPVPISVMPNAGLPQLGPFGATYPLEPAALAAAQARFVAEYGATLVGGCCGTTPEHLRAVVEAVRSVRPTRRRPRRLNAVSSLYTATDLDPSAAVVMIGERTNANGSKAFREALTAEDWDRTTQLATDQIAAGAQILDVCVDYVGRTAAQDMQAVAARFATATSIPLMIDSTEPNVLRAGLELLGARPVVNSVNFEDGSGPASRFARTMSLVKEHGAAVVALTIDEAGQARTAAQKVAVAVRLIAALTSEWGMRPDEIVIDPLTFPIATGQDETRRDAIETLTAICEIRRRFPGVHLILGISNVSFGLAPAARIVLNSVFLAEAQAAGLDVAIVAPGKIRPRAEIPEPQWRAAEDLIWDRRKYDKSGQLTHDPLLAFLDQFEPVETTQRPCSTTERSRISAADRLTNRIVSGNRSGLDADLQAALAAGLTPLQILNDVLLPAMAVVGERFGAGQTQLPFVLQSAEVMKAATNWLQPHLAANDSEGTPTSRGTIVLATVRGDVHDIGKNLVDIILSNNGYRVINLGIKVSIGEIINAAVENDADVIGLSGLLVKSTEVMREYLTELTERGLAKRWPIILGGAALNRRFVADDLQADFPGIVRYAKDAFEGLAQMPELVADARK